MCRFCPSSARARVLPARSLAPAPFRCMSEADVRHGSGQRTSRRVQRASILTWPSPASRTSHSGLGRISAWRRVSPACPRGRAPDGVHCAGPEFERSTLSSPNRHPSRPIPSRRRKSVEHLRRRADLASAGAEVVCGPVMRARWLASVSHHRPLASPAAATALALPPDHHHRIRGKQKREKQEIKTCRATSTGERQPGALDRTRLCRCGTCSRPSVLMPRLSHPRLP